MPRDACVGAILGAERAGVPALRAATTGARSSTSRPANAPVEALRRGLWHVVLSTRDEIPDLDPDFKRAGWQVRPLGDYWKLASWPNAGDARC